MNPFTARSSAYAYSVKFTSLLGSASLLTLASAIADQDRALAGEAMVAQADEIPESVLVTGSLIRGTVAVGVPVVNVSPMDFAQTGALTTADLFKNIPAADVRAGEVGTVHGGLVERGAKVNIRRLDTPDAPRALLMVDGMRAPPQGNGGCLIDPSIIPSISLDHIDILVDGASATYGSDAVSGVVNVILRRNFDGAMTQLRYTHRAGGGARYQAGQLWGRTWDGGQITMSYEWYDEVPSKGNAFSNYGVDFSPWGYDNKTPIGSSTPATMQVGTLTNPQSVGTACGYNTGAATPTPSKCYSVPRGVGADFPSVGVGPLSPREAPTFNWTDVNNTNFAGPLNPSAGTRNLFNPYSTIPYNASQQRNGGHFTVDQRLTSDISFYGSGYYSNRRAKFENQSTSTPTANNAITAVSVPTWNPYYPTGGAPSGLRLNYDMSMENPAVVKAYELDTRYQMGLNISLPREWAAQIFYAMTYTASTNDNRGAVHKGAVSAALGWTMVPNAGGGSGPSFGTWSKPANVPYLNLFCDPMAYKCNSDTTLNYISGYRQLAAKYWINEKGVKADGPLFDLPGGTVKMAIGADLTNYRLWGFSADNTNQPNLMIEPEIDAQGRQVWATFAQLNIPVFSEQNAMFGLRRLELEASWRHDQYSDVAGTSNPKLAFNWAPIDDLVFRGTWGNSFRAPAFGEISPTANVMLAGWNLGALQAAAANTIRSCGAVGRPLPAATSGAGKLQQAAAAFNAAMFASGATGYSAATGCLDTLLIPDPVAPYTQPAGTRAGPSGVVADPLDPISAFADPGFAGVAGLIQPGGISTLGGFPLVLPLRQFTGVGETLKPEIATNWGIGFQYTPTTNILRGLDIQATYYLLKINGALRGFGNPNDSRFADDQLSQAWPSPVDVGCPDLPNSVRPSIPIPANLVPSACAQWMTAVKGMVENPRAQVDAEALTRVYFVNDGSDFNFGFIKLDGIDWTISYDWDMGNLGAFNIGAAGTYYMHNYSSTTPGIVTNGYHTTTGSANAQAVGVSTLPTMQYRGRLGWSNGPWNVTGFMNYIGHYYHTQSAPPNVNGNTCTSTAWGAPAGGTYPCAQNGYSNLVPPWYTFDLSIGFDTGFDPANDYLKNIGLQLIIQNIFDKHVDFQYKGTAAGGPPCTCNPLRDNFGRQVSFVITKTW